MGFSSQPGIEPVPSQVRWKHGVCNHWTSRGSLSTFFFNSAVVLLFSQKYTANYLIRGILFFSSKNIILLD